MRTPAIHSTFGVDTARARRSDPSTSHEAADTNDIGTSIGAVLDCLYEEGPMIDELLVLRLHQLSYKFTEQRVRSARAALVKMDQVHFTGEKRINSRGNRMMVWAAGPSPFPAEPTPDLRSCVSCDTDTVSEVDRWNTGEVIVEEWKCPNCGTWNTREVLS